MYAPFFMLKRGRLGEIQHIYFILIKGLHVKIVIDTDLRPFVYLIRQKPRWEPTPTFANAILLAYRVYRYLFQSAFPGPLNLIM